MSISNRWGIIAPFTLMVIMEGCTIALTILAKTAFTSGLSPYVFIVYTNVLGTLILLPFSFFFHKEERSEEPLFTFSFFVRCFFLGFTGIFMFQNLAFTGLRYSSPVVVCAMGLLIPAFSFLIALVLRKTSLDWGMPSIRTKVIGTLISFGGAIVEEVYRGPYIRPASTPSPAVSRLLQAIHHHLVFYKSSNPDTWVLGGLFLAASAFSISIWNFIQATTMKKYPHVLKVMSFYSLAGTIQCAIFALFVERNIDAWKLKPDFDLILIILTAIFGSVVRSSVHVMCSRAKGPFYVPMFKPFGIMWAAIFGTSFFTNSLQYGSVIGALIAGMGYFTVMSGQVIEDKEKRTKHVNQKRESFEEHKVPLLQERDEEENGELLV